ncbi:hypothetical protein AB0B04_19055 [Streptomyces xinghaiensis]|uniref:Uncharacterized protein n=2 Tax=Streptomyces TaxID=1883 RepID=A0A420UXX3_9ACTN|nr:MULTISPECIES: hypothetical protein [Streptomyces]KNE83303.1 hypothetical protein ADZ36_05540 [Streptomyces fradiae]OFA36623.1 hypothetical protein BEN35_29640 [Streptomyces fradiae]PQM20620.1 hypothetical protein Sfr7A_25885 [Streptomyces xinghaiensis]RKM92562.1 hypothetical protein SFRA_024540 [Streptomyces xinghaiensis]RNC70529.1 hypothetical protein DC095_025530 [Streptomyces xinghaiensis]
MLDIETCANDAAGVVARLGTYPHRAPVMDEGALVEACRVQAGTWVTRRFDVAVPAELSGTGALVDLTAAICDAAGDTPDWATPKGADDGVTWYGLAHLDNAHADALRAYHGHGDAHLLGALYSLISAGAALRGGCGDVRGMDPFEDRLPVLDEQALIQTVRVQLNTWIPAVLEIPGYAAEEIRSAAGLSDVLEQVADAARAAFGGMDDGDSIRGMTHLAHARAHGLKAGYGDGDAFVFAALGSLVLAAACLT